MQGAEINDAKKVLATEATALLHGRAAAEEAARTAKTTFEEGALALSLPKFLSARIGVRRGLGVLTAYVRGRARLLDGEARRLIKGGGLSVNDEVLTDPSAVINAKDFEKDGVVKLSLGKKKHVLLTLS